MSRSLLCAALLLVFAATTAAQIPEKIYWQGYLTDGSGPLNGPVDLIISLYESESAASRVSRLDTTGVVAGDGVVNVSLGPFPAVKFDGPLFVGVAVNGEAELAPRTPLLSVPFARTSSSVYGFRAEAADDGAWRGVNVITGVSVNTIAAGAVGGTVSGGGGTAGASVYANAVSEDFGTVGGGRSNVAGGPASTIGGGADNAAGGEAAAIGGGSSNSAGGLGATVGGGSGNAAGSDQATVGGGANNTAGASLSTIGGGSGNQVTGNAATVGGGQSNTAGGSNAVVGGGAGNAAEGARATVGGGFDNAAGGPFATVGGGFSNSATGIMSAVPGGAQNGASGDYSLAAGRRSQVLEGHDGTFVWADATDEDFASTGPNQFLVRAGGGVGIGTNSPASQLSVNGGMDVTGRVGIGIDAPRSNLDIVELERPSAALSLEAGTGTAWSILSTGNGDPDGGGLFQIRDEYAVADRLTITSDGMVGIGTGSPSRLLSVAGSAHFADSVGIGTDSPSTLLHVEQSGDMNAELSMVASSGKAWKIISTGTADPDAGGHLRIRDAATDDDRLTVTTCSPNDWVEEAGCIGIGTNGPSTLLALNRGAGGGDAGITQGQLGSGSSMEFTTRDSTGSQATRMMIEGYDTPPPRHPGDIIFYRDDRGEETLSMMIDGLTGRVGIGTFSPGYALEVNGIVKATNISPSDARLKKDVAPIDDPLATLRGLTGVTYEWDREAHPDRRFREGRRLGFIAQDVAPVLPEVVAEDADGYLSLDYDQVIALLVEALKERDRKSERLEHRAGVLENRVAELERLVGALADGTGR